MFILLGGELACIEYFILTANCTVCKDCTYFKNDLRVFDKSEQIGLYKFIKKYTYQDTCRIWFIRHFEYFL